MTLKRAYKEIDNIINNQNFIKAKMIKNYRFYKKIMKKESKIYEVVMKYLKNEKYFGDSVLLDYGEKATLVCKILNEAQTQIKANLINSIENLKGEIANGTKIST